MEDVKHAIALTNNNTDNMSRMQMLQWVNTTTNASYTKIEQLCSGVAYCQMLEQLFPQSVGLKRIKANAKLEHEYMHNLRLLQTALIRLNFDKTVPIDRLLKGRFQDNLEFLQWFIKFYNSPPSSGKTASQPQMPKKRGIPRQTPKQNPVMSNGASKDSDLPKSLVAKKLEEKEKLQDQISATERERNFYYQKLAAIEALVGGSINAENRDTEMEDWSQRCLNILYNEEAPSN